MGIYYNVARHAFGPLPPGINCESAIVQAPSGLPEAK